MTAVIWILSVPPIAEFVFAPVNLWTGRTIGNYTRFTGLPPRSATRILAPLKLATAVLLAAGLAVRPLSIAGAALALAVSGFYLARLADPGRRDPAGLAGFAVFGALACALLALRPAAYCLQRAGRSRAGWDTLVVSGVRSCPLWSFTPLPGGGTGVSSTETFAGLPAALLRPLVARRWNRAFQAAVDGLMRHTADRTEASR